MTKQQLITDWKQGLQRNRQSMNSDAWYCSLLGLSMRLMLAGYISQDKLEQELADWE